MYWFYKIFVLILLLTNILCDINKDYIDKQNVAMTNFFSICALLIVSGFIIVPFLLIIILPCIVDPIDYDNDDSESINSSNESQRKEQKSESDESSSLKGDDDDDEEEEEEESIDEQDREEISSF